MKRTFTARNRGHFPIAITGFDINESPCEGYGFRVLQCEPLTLLPNQSHSMEIAFTPDFTQTQVERTLRLHSTALGSTALNFTLMATLPTHMLILCAAVLPRPSWEHFLYYSSAVVSVFLLLCVVTAATLEADRILKCGLVAMVTVVSPQAEYSAANSGVLLDLKAVAKEDASGPMGAAAPAGPSLPALPAAELTKSARGKKKVKKSKQTTLISSAWSSASASSVSAALSSALPAAVEVAATTKASAPPKRSPLPSPTPAPSPPTVKEETRIFKPKAANAKKAKNKSGSAGSTATATEGSKGTPPSSVAAPPADAADAEKRMRSSSVPSPSRQKAAASVTPPIPVTPTLPAAVPVTPATLPEPSGVKPTSSVWRSRTSTKPLVKNPTPQLPVGKILPEIRRPGPIVQPEAEAHSQALPKPIGYPSGFHHHPHQEKQTTLPAAWNPPSAQPESSSRYWFNGIDNNQSIPVDSGRMWMQQDHSLFAHPSHQVNFN